MIVSRDSNDTKLILNIHFLCIVTYWKLHILLLHIAHFDGFRINKYFQKQILITRIAFNVVFSLDFKFLNNLTYKILKNIRNTYCFIHIYIYYLFILKTYSFLYRIFYKMFPLSRNRKFFNDENISSYLFEYVHSLSQRNVVL